MRKIVNKVVKFSEKDSATYGELIMTCVKSPELNGQGQPQGYDYETLKKIKRVDDVIGTDKLKDEFEFEDSDFEFIKRKVNSTPWNIYSTELIDFIEYVVK